MGHYLLSVEAIPLKVRRLMVLFDSNAYEIFLVGGAVRDLLLGKTPKDYDLTTIATPDQIIELCEKNNLKYIPTGLQHGTITIVFEDLPIEVTTYRIDGTYSDNRHPDEVTFTTDLYKDLSRRDFTINAMAVDCVGSVYDYFDGVEDLLQHHCIRTVGDPNARFNEDALRMLRAYRFAAQLDFDIDIPKEIFIQNLSLLRNVSSERIRDELNKFLLGSSKILTYFEDFMIMVAIKFPKLMDLFMIQNNRWHTYQSLTQHTAHVIDLCPKDLITRLAALLHDLGKHDCYSEEIIEGKICGHFYGHPEVSAELARQFLTALKYPNSVIDQVSFLVAEHNNEIAYSVKSIKKMLRKIDDLHFDDYSIFDKLIDLKFADRVTHNGALLLTSNLLPIKVDKYKEIKDSILESQNCFTLKDLAINGRDLLGLGFTSGPLLGSILNTSLEAVIDGTVPNIKEDLITFIKEKTI